MNLSFEKWCEKLLDTGKGNRLINFRSSGNKSIQIFSPELKEIFEKLSSGNKMIFYDLDEYAKNNNLDSTKLNEKFSSGEFLDIKNKMKKKEILAFKNGEKTKKTLSNLRKIASDFLLEKGLNILYISFGLLQWSDSDGENLKSPLILMPIVIDIDKVSSNFTLSLYEDEITTNPTLIYKLKNEQNLSLVEFREAGYEEESILDYYSRLTESIKIKNWSVIEQVHIGLFSFLKINMYKDLKENEDKILENKIIKMLLNIKVDENLENSEADENTLENSLHNVVDADSSQMMAIWEAKMGRSFVLQGPPGTGKSQTITNLISEFLYDEKKVLFVSEKLAALNVVFNNLKKAGLSDFCLQLHSNNTNKKDFLKELYKMLSLNKVSVNEKKEISINELKKSENQLDSYVNELHTRFNIINMTPYEILGEISRFRNAKQFQLNFDSFDDKGETYFIQARDSLESFDKFYESINYEFLTNPWYGFNRCSVSYSEKTKLRENINRSIDFLNKILSFNKNLSLNLGLSLKSLDNIENNYDFLSAISEISFFDTNFFYGESLKNSLKYIKSYNSHSITLKSLEKVFSHKFSMDIFEQDVNALYLKYENEYNSVFRIFNGQYKKDKEIVNRYSNTNEKNPKFKETLKYLRMAREILNLRKALIQDRRDIFNSLNQDDLNQEINWLNLQNELEELFLYDLDLVKNLQNIDKTEFLEIKKQISEFLNFLTNNNSGIESLNYVQECFDKDKLNIFQDNIEDVVQKLKLSLNNFDGIENWIRFYSSLQNLDGLKIKEFALKCSDEKIFGKDLIESFSLSFYVEWLDFVIRKTPSLNNFSRQTQDMAVEKFKLNDCLKLEISKAEIVTKLLNKMPDLNSITSGSQISILVREANKKIKQKPVRLVLSEIGELVQTLKPVFLMSPLSVSTYLDSNACKFDVVIFDEASQIFPWDAIGAIYRAKQVIVVGDSKQMPPSNFFTAGLLTDETEEDEESSDALDFESILDLCASSFSQKCLNWHYRSKTEELIAFSNYNFYNNSLISFPSPSKEMDNMGVRFHYVEDGIFNRKTHKNVVEAEKVVDLIFEHFKNTPNLSLGVVAFSISQQEAIEDIIQKRRENDSSYDKYFDIQSKEPFFVKNLETVQGDERDTIIFSIAYAKDENGKFLHNFGPLNRRGGERRLNVAVTRAKQNIEVVSSIKYYDIDLGKTNAVGAKMLRDYLDMAERGVSKWLDEKEISSKTIDEKRKNGQIESEICQFLRENGYIVEAFVGCSDCKIDIAVKHPKRPNFLVAIECDGYTYKSGVTTRDRDRLRQQVLERLGWAYYRVWSIDWYINKKFEQERLIKFIDSQIKLSDEKSANLIKINAKNGDFSENSFIIEEKFIKKDLKSLFKEYNEYDIFSNSFPTFNNSIFDIVKTEQPITEELLLKKTIGLLGREKLTQSTRELFNKKMNEFGDKIFKIEDYYVTDKNIKISMRVPKQESVPRDILLISNAELSSGLYEIIKKSVGINKKGLYNTIVGLLGFSKIGTKVQTKLDNSLDFLINNNYVKKDGDEYFIVS